MKTRMKNLLKAVAFLIIMVCTVDMVSAATPPKPSRDQIARDLIGRKLTEGYENGWFSNDWVWIIEQGEIKALKIEKVLANTDRDYSVIVLMRLQAPEQAALNAKVKVNYHLVNNVWKMEYAVSQGVKVVWSHKYDDCVKFSIGTYSFFFHPYPLLNIVNNSDLVLYCAGWYYKYEEWHKFSFYIGPHEKTQIKDAAAYKIAFIERL